MILKSTRELFRAIGQSQPTVLVFEDLHWADQSSVNLLESLLLLGRETRLLFVHVFRPLFEETGERVLRLCRERFADEYEEIRLEPLDQTQTALLVRNLLDLPELPAPLLAAIAGKTEGNPFYIEEVVRSLIDEGAIEYSEGRFRLTDRINRVVIPGTIRDVIMSRIDLLDESARRVLQMASVVGRTFYPRILSYLVEREEALEGDLALLLEKQLIQESSNRWDVAVGPRTIADEVEYSSSTRSRKKRSMNLCSARRGRSCTAEWAKPSNVCSPPDCPSSTRCSPITTRARSGSSPPSATSAWRAKTQSLRRRSARRSTTSARRRRSSTSCMDRRAVTARVALLCRSSSGSRCSTPARTSSRSRISTARSNCSASRCPRGSGRRRCGGRSTWPWSCLRIYVYEGRRGPMPNVERQRELFKIYFDRGQAEVTQRPAPTVLPDRDAVAPLSSHGAGADRVAPAACTFHGDDLRLSGLSFAIADADAGGGAGLLREDNIGDVFRYRVMLFIYDYLRGEWSDAPVLPPELVQEAPATRDGVGRHDLHPARRWIAISGAASSAGARVLPPLAEIRDAYGYEYAENNHKGMEALSWA